MTALIATIHSGPSTAAAQLFAIGVTAWMAGHLLTAYKTRTWRSRLAQTIVTRTPLRYIDPVHSHNPRAARRPHYPNRVQLPVDDFAEWERELTSDPRPTTTMAPMRPSQGSVYGKRAVNAAGNFAVRKIPGARVVRSACWFVR